MLALDFDAFDQDASPGGWRAVAQEADCARSAAALIAAWREARLGSLRRDQIHLLWWHEGQLLASAGDDDAAIERLLAARTFEDQTVPPGMPEGDVVIWRAMEAAEDAYRDATVAFLQRDRAALQEAYARLLAVPAPPGYADLQDQLESQTGLRLAWPPNQEAIEVMIACPDSRFGVDCRENDGR
jgi:hypothetical protein